MDENLEELYENLAYLDDEEYFDDDDDTDEDIDDEEDNIAEDPGDDEDWWHSGEDDTIEIVDMSSIDKDEADEPDDPDQPVEPDIPEETEEYDDNSMAETINEPIDSIEYNPAIEIESATTGRELFDAIADTIETLYDNLTFGGLRCNIVFVSTSEFESLPYENKYPSENDDDEYDETPDDEQNEDEDENYNVSSLSDLNTVYFIYDYEGEQ